MISLTNILLARFGGAKHVRFLHVFHLWNPLDDFFQDIFVKLP